MNINHQLTLIEISIDKQAHQHLLTAKIDSSLTSFFFFQLKKIYIEMNIKSVS